MRRSAGQSTEMVIKNLKDFLELLKREVELEKSNLQGFNQKQMDAEKNLQKFEEMLANQTEKVKEIEANFMKEQNQLKKKYNEILETMEKLMDKQKQELNARGMVSYQQALSFSFSISGYKLAMDENMKTVTMIAALAAEMSFFLAITQRDVNAWIDFTFDSMLNYDDFDQKKVLQVLQEFFPNRPELHENVKKYGLFVQALVLWMRNCDDPHNLEGEYWDQIGLEKGLARFSF